MQKAFQSRALQEKGESEGRSRDCSQVRLYLPHFPPPSPARLPRPCSLEASPPRPGLLGAGVTPQVQSERNRSPALGGQEQSRVKKPSPGLKSLPSLSAWANSSPPRSWRLSFVKGDRERCRREGLGEGPRGRGTPRGVLLAGTGHRSLLPPQPHVVGWAGLPKGPDWPR